MSVIDFPPRQPASEETSEIIEERITSLQEFLISIFKITAINTLHPTKLKLNLLLNKFLGVEMNWNHIHSLILAAEQSSVKEHDQHSRNYARQIILDRKKKTEFNMVRTFIHNLFLLNSLESIVDNFVENFLSHKIEDVDEIQWTIPKAKNAINQLQNFMSQMQRFLREHFFRDCKDILRAFRFKLRHPKKLLQEDLSFKPSVEQLEQDEEDKEEELILRCLRKQIEGEIYMKCIDRVKFIIHRTFYEFSEKYQQKLKPLVLLPKSYFDIQDDFLSAASWKQLINHFKSIQYPALPSDKIDNLVSACKYISILHHQDHQDDKDVEEDANILGADDLLPCYVYAIIQAQMPNLLLLNFELQCLHDPMNNISEAGYCLATLEAVVHHILEMDLKQAKFFNS